MELKNIIYYIGIAFIAGCIDIPTVPDTPEDVVQPVVQTSTKPYSICIGVENGYAGACPGTTLDSSRMAALLESRSSRVVLLQNEAATKARVLSELSSAMTNDFVILYYSGHGGQNYYGDSSEADGKDEYLCLYDCGLLDNTIWNTISQGKNVMLIFDCCHSETMYRAPTFKRVAMCGARNSVNMLCWSGCPDSTYSYGSATGGEFTNSLLRNFTGTETYSELWKKISSDKVLKSYEEVQKTELGQNVWTETAFTLK